jgi:16S rRNA (cytosine1402-N4)-methyltransferase
MTSRGDRPGGSARHVPVLLKEACEALSVARGGVFVDGTFGAGGYTQAILRANPVNRVVAIDRDPEVIGAGAALAAKFKRRLTLISGRFGSLVDIVREAGHQMVDGVVLDIGVSSMQLDQPERGFSFRVDGPLDMRMERTGVRAADLVNGASEAELADIFHFYGEERRARAVARAIVERRRTHPVETTGQLAELVAGLVRTEPGVHPATRIFQALRIAVNDELGELVLALHAAERVLKPGGRLAVVTFHSLEDRIVKQFMAARAGRAGGASRHIPTLKAPEPSFTLVTMGPVLPGEDETARNPRARSAKLRAAERTAAPAQDTLHGIVTLAELPKSDAPGGRR